MISVLIDPGHGGPNLGTCEGTLIEKDVTLALAKDVALSLHGLDVACELTRYEDEELSLEARGELSKKHGADLVISIHVNASENGGLYGADLFHGVTDAKGRDVCVAIASAMPLRMRTMRIHPATQSWERVRNVLTPHQHTTAILVECGYSSNAADRAYLLTPWGRAQIVTAIRSGVCRYGEMQAAA